MLVHEEWLAFALYDLKAAQLIIKSPEVKLYMSFDEEFSYLLENALELNPHVSASRYPDSCLTISGLTTAQLLIAQAEHIYNFVLQENSMKSSYFTLLFITLYVHQSNSMMPWNTFTFSQNSQNIRDQIEQALQNKSNLDAPLNTVSRLPALHEALDKPELYDLVEPLLQAGADPNISTYGSLTTPLHRAAMYDTSIRHVLLLLSYGAYVNSTGEDGQTPLIEAVTNGAYKVVTILLKHGANPNIQDKWGNTALGQACKYYPDYENKYTLRQSMIKLLLYYRANPYINNSWGKTALDIARKNGFDELAQLMENQKLRLARQLLVIFNEVGIAADINVAQHIADVVYSSHA